jgi:predicted RNA-binding protein YlqC (UPF0109 family)
MKQTELIQLAKKELPQLEAIIGLNAAKGTDIKTLALQELEYLQMIGTTKPEIYECMPVSIISAIKTVLKQNLTLDPYAGLVYVKTRNVKMNNEWAKVLEIQPSANGIISINRQCGRVFDIERPEVLKNDKGKVIGVKFRYLVPRAKAIRHGLKKLGTNQNERAQVTGERLIVDIDQAADEAAHEDEYISHDEAPPVTNNHNHINISLEELPSDEPVEELEL